MGNAVRSRSPALTRALKDRANPVRGEIDSLISKSGLAALRAESGYDAELRVDNSGVSAGTVGTAFDLAMRLLIDPVPNLQLALTGAGNISPQMIAAAVDLGTLFGGRFDTHTAKNAPIDRPLGVDRQPDEQLLRAAWALALLIDVYRAGPDWLSHSPVALYGEAEPLPSVEGLLALAPEDRAGSNERCES